MRPWTKRLGALVVAAALLGGVASWLKGPTLAAELARAEAALGTVAAGQLLRRLAEQYPENAAVFFHLARQQRREGRLDQAQVSLQRARELGWFQPQLDREQLFLRAHRNFAQAEPELQRLRDTDPANPEVLLILADGFSRLRYHAKAEALLQLLLTADPENGRALCLRGRIKLEKQQFALARADLEPVYQRGAEEPAYVTSRFLLASCLLDLGQFEEAIRLFRDCAADDADDPRIHYNLGRCFICLAGQDAAGREAHQREAVAAFETALRLRPRDVATLLQLAAIHEERGDFTTTLTFLRRAEREAPELGEVWFRLARALRALGQNDQAAVYQKRLQERQAAAAAKPGPTGRPPGRSNRVTDP